MTLQQAPLVELIREFQRDFYRLVANVETVVHGKRDVVRNALICLFARGHLLIEDVPGVAKTSLAKAITRSIAGGRMGRVQFTPDLLPTDLLGVEVFHQSRLTFDFRPGPIFCNVLLGDEINRASPKTQSALLEVMAERQVTVNGTSYPVDDPFLCIATQNSVEHHGTFPLPEAQLDRFTMRVGVGYPSFEDEVKVISQGVAGGVPEVLRPVVGMDRVRAMIDTVRRVHVDDSLARYIAAITAATRNKSGELRGLRVGASPRGSIALALAAQALAASEGRDHATPDDVNKLAEPVLAHRLIVTPGAAQRRSAAEILADIIATTPVPGLRGPR